MLPVLDRALLRNCILCSQQMLSRQGRDGVVDAVLSFSFQALPKAVPGAGRSLLDRPLGPQCDHRGRGSVPAIHTAVLRTRSFT